MGNFLHFLRTGMFPKQTEYPGLIQQSVIMESTNWKYTKALCTDLWYLKVYSKNMFQP